MAPKDLLAALEAFVSARKILLGTNESYEWGPGFNPHERKACFPIELEGESPSQAKLEIIGFPQARALKFRISLCWNAAICRLDYTDELHINSRKSTDEAIPYSVRGPHFHSWELNRRFFKGTSTAPKLFNAEPFKTPASFDSALRWFCQRANIDQPLGGHLIELPPRDRLL